MKEDLIQMEIIANFHLGHHKFSYNYNQVIIQFLEDEIISPKCLIPKYVHLTYNDEMVK